MTSGVSKSDPKSTKGGIDVVSHSYVKVSSQE
jgi:hypothetical protein